MKKLKKEKEVEELSVIFENIDEIVEELEIKKYVIKKKSNDRDLTKCEQEQYDKLKKQTDILNSVNVEIKRAIEYIIEYIEKYQS